MSGHAVLRWERSKETAALPDVKVGGQTETEDGEGFRCGSGRLQFSQEAIEFVQIRHLL
jgi:hypothetical protein